MGGELGANGLVGSDRVGIAGLRVAAERDQMDEHAAALDMGEELVPEPDPRRRALDQPGDVGEHELALAIVDRPQDRLQRGERVVGDLRRRPRQARQQRRLAGVREPDEAGVGKQLQPQLDPSRLALEAALGKARGLAGGAGEALVAVTAGAARGDDRLLPGLDQVVAAPLEPLDLGAGRHGDDVVRAARPVTLAALAVATAPGAPVGREAKRRQVAPRGVADQDHVAAAAAVAAVGTAARHVGLAAKRDHAVTARAALDVDLCLVVQHRMNGRGVEIF